MGSVLLSFLVIYSAAIGPEVRKSAATVAQNGHLIPPANLARSAYPEWAHHHWYGTMYIKCRAVLGVHVVYVVAHNTRRQ